MRRKSLCRRPQTQPDSFCNDDDNNDDDNDNDDDDNDDDDDDNDDEDNDDDDVDSDINVFGSFVSQLIWLQKNIIS